jgi:hypothetical protein
MSNFILHTHSAYNPGSKDGIAANSLVATDGTALTMTGGFLAKASANQAIVGVSTTNKTFASDNQTVVQDVVVYRPTNTSETFRLKCAGGASVVFAGDLVASNTINLNVNGVAMTEVTYASSNNNTLELIATQLATQFPTVVESAVRSGTRTVAITVRPGTEVVITDIVVAAGAGQTTGSQVDPFRQAEVGKFFDILATTQFVDGQSAHASVNQLKFEKAESQSYNIFSVT